MSLVSFSLGTVLDTIDENQLQDALSLLDYNRLVCLTKHLEIAKRNCYKKKFYFLISKELDDTTVKCVRLFYPDFRNLSCLDRTNPVLVLCVVLLGLDNIKLCEVANDSTLDISRRKVDDFSDPGDEDNYRRYNDAWYEDLTHYEEEVYRKNERPEVIPDRPNDLLSRVSAFARDNEIDIVMDTRLPETGPYRLYD